MVVFEPDSKPSLAKPRERVKVGIMKRHCIAVIVLFSLAGGTGLGESGSSAAAGDISPHAYALHLNDAFAEVYEKVSPAVVVIEVTRAQARRGGRGIIPEGLEFFFRGPDHETPPQSFDARPRPNQGSGFIITADGYIVTNHHVINEAAEDGIRVTLRDGTRMQAEVVGTDDKTDLAVLKVDGEDLPHVELGDSDEVRVGQFAFAIGAPFELPYTFTFGLVSAKGRTNLTRDTAYENYIQTDASINPGNSGGPLCDIHGRVIGVNTLINRLNSGLGFAIPVNMVKDVSGQLIAQGRMIRPWLGIYIEGLQENDRLQSEFPSLERGVVVARIPGGTPAYQSDLRPGDVILEVDGREVAVAGDVQQAVLSRGVGDEVILRVWRRGNVRDIMVRTGEQPSSVVPASHQKEEDAAPAPPEQTPRGELLGMEVQNLTREMARTLGVEETNGVVVTKVEPGSPAEVGGISVGDVITHLGSTPVRSRNTLLRAIRDHDASKGFMFLIHREGQRTYEIVRP